MNANQFQSAVFSIVLMLMLNGCGGGGSSASGGTGSTGGGSTGNTGNSGGTGGTGGTGTGTGADSGGATSGGSTPVTPITISGTVTGLSSGSTVVLANNGGDKLSMSSNGSFTFASAIALNGSYAATVSTQPMTQRCNVTNATGTQLQASVASVAVACTAAVETILHSFTGTATDGSSPMAEMILGSDGNLYGTTFDGGASDHGTVFKLTPAGVVTVLHSFAGGATDGAYPMAALTAGPDGNFYGVTSQGGASGQGTFFSITPGGAATLLHSFAGGASAAAPRGALLLASDRNFYGLSSGGGVAGFGTFYSITPAGVATVLYSFAGTPTDGAYPAGALTQGADGNFYAVTPGGGAEQMGTVIKLTPAGLETVLYAFKNDVIDGVGPHGALVINADGNFYGTTSGGGTAQQGTVFKITPAGVKTTLYSFAGGLTDGKEPQGTLVLGKDGNFYGTTAGGGPGYNGTLYMLTPDGVETLLHGFTYDGKDGAELWSSVTFGADGYLYGVTVLGGTASEGTIFRY